MAPTLLTSILHVMIPGSLLTALKALLRDIASVFLELKYHKARGDAPHSEQGAIASP